MSAAQSETPRGLARVAQFGRAALGLVLDTALPPLCAACRQPLGGSGGLCAACWSKVSFIAPPYCERLGIPFAYDPGPGILSMEAIADPPAYGRARAAVRFDDVARDLVHALKYGDRLDLAATLGGWMARAGRELLGGSGKTSGPTSSGGPRRSSPPFSISRTRGKTSVSGSVRVRHVRGCRF
jgi:hypothetical protein